MKWGVGVPLLGLDLFNGHGSPLDYRGSNSFTFFDSLLSLVGKRFYILCHDGATPILPFGSVSNRVVETFVTRHAKNVTVFELLRKWDHVIVEELQLPFVPKVCRVHGRPSVSVRLKHFFKQVLVVALIDVPVLHGVTDITRLHDVFDHHRGSGIVDISTASRT